MRVVAAGGIRSFGCRSGLAPVARARSGRVFARARACPKVDRNGGRPVADCPAGVQRCNPCRAGGPHFCLLPQRRQGPSAVVHQPARRKGAVAEGAFHGGPDQGEDLPEHDLSLAGDGRPRRVQPVRDGGFPGAGLRRECFVEAKPGGGIRKVLLYVALRLKPHALRGPALSPVFAEGPRATGLHPRAGWKAGARILPALRGSEGRQDVVAQAPTNGRFQGVAGELCDPHPARLRRAQGTGGDRGGFFDGSFARRRLRALAGWRIQPEEGRMDASGGLAGGVQGRRDRSGPQTRAGDRRAQRREGGRDGVADALEV